MCQEYFQCVTRKIGGVFYMVMDRRADWIVNNRAYRDCKKNWVREYHTT